MSIAQGQLWGKELAPASDRYSFGVVAFEALTGHVPYQAETPAAVMIAQIQAPLPDPRTVNPAISENVERALLRALSKDPENRFPSCTAFVRALAATSAEMAAPTPAAVAVAAPAEAPSASRSTLPAATIPAAPVPVATTPVPARATSPMRNRAVVIGASVLVAGLALAGILWASGLGKSTRTSTAPPAAATPAH